MYAMYVKAVFMACFMAKSPGKINTSSEATYDALQASGP